jgi:hypothetical protein
MCECTKKKARLTNISRALDGRPSTGGGGMAAGQRDNVFATVGFPQIPKKF